MMAAPTDDDPTAAATAALAALAADPLTAPLVKDDATTTPFDAPALAGRLLAASARGTRDAQSDASSLRSTATTLHDAAAALVRARRDDLVAQLGGLTAADAAVQGVQAPAAALRAALARARAAVTAPVTALRDAASSLERMQAAAAVVGAARARAAAAGRVLAAAESGDVLTLAHAVADAEALVTQEADTGLAIDWATVPAADGGATAALAPASAAARAAALGALRAALDAGATADAGDALLAASWLGTGAEAVEAVVVDGAARVAAAGARAAAAPTGDAAWTAADAALAELAAGAGVAASLDAAAAGRRDPATGARVAASLPASALATFWATAPRALGGALPSAGPLAAAYPRLAAAFDAAMARAGAGVPAPPASAAAEALAPPRRAWAAAARARAVDAASAAFGGAPRAPLPASADVQRLVARLHDVLTDGAAPAGVGVSGGSALADASALAGRAAAAGVTAAASRAAAMLAPDAGRTDGACGGGAARNIALACAASELARSLSALLPRAPPPAASELAPSLDALTATAAEAVAPLFADAEAHAAAAAARAATRPPPRGAPDYGAPGDPPAVAAPAPWAADVCASLAHFRAEFLARFSPPLPATDDAPPASAPAALTSRLAARVALLVTRHAACVRPLSSGGAVALAADLAAVEAALAEALGARAAAAPPGTPVAGLAALRRLLFVKDGDLGGGAAAASLAALSPRDRVLALLSRAPAAIHHPASTHPGGVPAFVSWLDAAPASAVADAVDAAIKAAGSAPSLEAGWDGGVAPALSAAVRELRAFGKEGREP